MSNRFRVTLLQASIIVACGLAASSCTTLEPRASIGDALGSAPLLPEVPLGTLSEPQQSAHIGVEAMEKGDLETASLRFNSALQLDITNPYLQFLNGLTYHKMYRRGDSAKAELAENGYKLAIQFDATNWIPFFYLGQLYLDMRRFPEAQAQFSKGLLLNADDQDMLYSFATASYYSGDPEAAAGALETLRERGVTDPNVLRASSMVMAALNDKQASEEFLHQYQDAGANPKEIEQVRRRTDQWSGFHQFATGSGALLPAAMESAAPSSPPAGEVPAAYGDNAFSDGEVESNRMAIVDVVMIRTEETISSSRGVNLLNGLTLQFGVGQDDSLPLPGFSLTYNDHRDEENYASRSITRALSIPAINYSLNIANANNVRNEILARPTLIAMEGQESEFFSGVNIEAVAVGGATGEGSTVQINKEIGVLLKVTPNFLDDGRVLLDVNAQRTFLTTPNTTSVTFEYRVDTSMNNVKAKVALNFGETLIIGGLSEKETELSRDGVPLLQDIPGVQYLFSAKKTRDFQKSVLILITPRKPPYVYREKGVGKAPDGHYSSPALDELKSRYADWFKPYPNWASVFHHMQQNKLYREFRTGDVTLERWENHLTHRDRLRQILDYLYY